MKRFQHFFYSHMYHVQFPIQSFAKIGGLELKEFMGNVKVEALWYLTSIIWRVFNKERSLSVRESGNCFVLSEQ